MEKLLLPMLLGAYLLGGNALASTATSSFDVSPACIETTIIASQSTSFDPATESGSLTHTYAGSATSNTQGDILSIAFTDVSTLGAWTASQSQDTHPATTTATATLSVGGSLVLSEEILDSHLSGAKIATIVVSCVAGSGSAYF